MTKKFKSSKSNENESRPFRFQSLHERLNNININVVHRIRYHDDLPSLERHDDLIRSSHFHQSLEHWSTLNFSEAFSKLHQNLFPLAGSLEQIVYNREQILTLLRQSLNEQNPLILETLLDLIVQLARDLQGDFYTYYKDYLFVDIINLLINSKTNKQQQNEMNTQLLEQIFQCLTYLFKYLWRIMLKDLVNLYELYSKYLFSSVLLTTNSEYIRTFACESFAYLLRKIENYQPFIDYLYNRQEITDDELESLTLVFSSTCQNVQSTFHSCTKNLLISLLKMFLVKPQLLHSSIKTLYRLLIEHTDKQNMSILWYCFVEIYRSIDHQQTVNCLIYQTFYEIFQLFIEKKMINEMKICSEFLIIVEQNSDEEFLQIHYQTVWKLLKYFSINQELIDIYYRFLDQTSIKLICQEMKTNFQDKFYEKLPKEFSLIFWNYLFENLTNQEDILDYFVEFILIQRKKFQMIIYSNDSNELILEKLQLLKSKAQFLNQEKIPKEILEFLQLFLQKTFTIFEQTDNLLNEQHIWKALLLLHSISNPIFAITNDHLEKFSSHLRKDSLETNPMISFILFELITHSHRFSSSFWYSLLEKQSSLEILLLSTRISFLLNKPADQKDFDKFLHLLKENLSSFNSSIRLLTLNILCSYENDVNHPLINCLLCEQSPLNVYEYRSKIIYLQKLSVDFVLLNKYSTYFHLSMRYLLGLLATNFTPLWSIIIELLGSYGNKAIESIGHQYFWSILNEKFQLIKEKTFVNQINQNQIFIEYFENEKDESINTEIDYIQYRINLFRILNLFANECENKTKLLVPIIFEFFSNEYYDHLLAIGLIDRNRSSYQIQQQISSQRLTKTSSIKTLEIILKLLKQFHHPKQWFEPERLYEFYKRLLLSTDNSIQQLAFECLLTCTQLAQSEIHADFLPHSESLMPIFNPSTARKTFHDLIQGVLLDSNLSNSIRNQYAFVLIRILFSKLNSKRSLGSTTRGRKDYLELNRKYLFQFLITFASNDLYHSAFHFFIQLLLEPFQQELFTSNSNQYLQIFEQKLQIDALNDFHLKSYEIFLKSIQRSLSLLKTFISKLRIYIQQEIDFLIKFYLLTIKFVDYLTNRNDSSNETKSIRILLKRLRSMSYKGLQNLFDLFDNNEQYQFNRQLIDDIWLCSIKETYLNDLIEKTKQREDLVHLLKLTIIWSRTNIYKKQFLDPKSETKDLIKCFIHLLNENLINENKQLIIEFIWNILQINPDDDFIKPYYDQLLSYLTKISNSMIETTNSIALSSKEFDILLILSQKQYSIEKIEQLCSIFIRLLRQNLLGKKTKKIKQNQEQNFNILILKILQNLVKNLANPIEKYLHLLTIFCAKLTQRDQRIEFTQLIQVFLDQSNDTSSNTIFFLKQFIELNSWSNDQLDEPDYERRLNSYNQLAKQISNLNEIDSNQPEYLCLFYHCLYELQNSIHDLSLREYASQIIDLFLEKIPSFENYLLMEIRSILKQSTINRDIQYEYLRHLILLIDRNSNQNQDLIDLKRLRNYQDIEIDFFHNIIHVQLHRRLRALKRLKTIHLEQEFHLSTIKIYLLPIICSFINDVLNEHIDDIQDEIVFQCLTIFSEKLPWIQYNQLLIYYFRQLISRKKLFNLKQKRCLTKTLSAIIDGFHFHLNNQIENERIRRTIQQRLFPMIFKLLSENCFSIDNLTNSNLGIKNATIDDQRQQAVLLTITCSFIATKLLILFPHEYLEQHLSTIILHLITLLRSRIYSIRDQARDCLCKCITILGQRYFKFIIQELITGLQRGYQHFVLLHTIHYILIHLSTLSSQFPVDSSVEIIVNLFTEDFFNLEKTESSKANEHENSSYKPSNIPEAKTNKTANVFELLGKLIHSKEQLFLCIEPLRRQLLFNNDSRQISKCEKCLQRFQNGLILNMNLTLDILFSFIYHLLTKTEETTVSNEQISTNRMKIIIEQRNQYHLVPSEPKRGHARVAQAIKYTKKTNIHCFISWTLNLLNKLIKKSKTNDKQFLSMIDPFLDHIEICLNSQYTDVIVSSLRNLSSILEYSLPSLTKQRITNIYKKVFDLLKIFSAIAGSNDLNDLLTLAYKILGLFVQRSINDNIQLTSDEYQCLLTYIESDLLNIHRQSSAFLLLRSIMRHSTSIISNDKHLRTQLDELLRSRIIFLIIQSPYDHIRSTCRDLFHLYLFSYEHTKTKLKSYFDFLLLQLDYDDFNGRLSVLIFLENLFQDLTKQRLNDYAAYFFLPLACHFYNETNFECKKQFETNLKLLLEKIDRQQRNDILKNIVFSWFNDQIEHRCLTLQLFLFFIEIDQEQFDQYLNDIFEFLQKEFQNIQENLNDEQEKFYDQYVYHLINVLIYVMKYCPNSLQNIQLRSKWLNLLKIIDENGLLHAHVWIRFLSAQIFGLLFDAHKPDEIVRRLKIYQIEQENSKSVRDENGSSRKRLKKSNLDQEPLFVHYVIISDLTNSYWKKLQRLSICSCSQLKPSNLSEEFSLQIIKNLIYLSKILLLGNANEFNLVIRRCCRLTTFESTKYPNEITRRSAILKWMTGLSLELSNLLTDHLKTFLIVIEREIERDETTSNLSLKTLAQDVFDVFKRHFDIHLITSIYADIAKQRRVKRSERKQKLAILAINQPEIAYRKKRVKQTKRLGLGKKKRLKAIEKAKTNRKKKVMKKISDDDIDDF